MSTKTCRELAELDFISVRRLLAEASAKLHMVDVMKDGLQQQLLIFSLPDPVCYNAFTELVHSEMFSQAKGLVGSLEAAVFECECRLLELETKGTEGPRDLPPVSQIN